jgi:8-oxo-dGTP diphosphatase
MLILIPMSTTSNGVEEQRPRVGVGVLIFKDGKVLLGKRKGSHATGEYAGTGGHLEYMESFITGIEIGNCEFLCVTNMNEYAPKHYVDIGIKADWISGVPTVLEPTKVESWDWYDIDNLPTPLFATELKYLDAIKNNARFFDIP